MTNDCEVSLNKTIIMDQYGRYDIFINVLGWSDVMRTLDQWRSWDMGVMFAFFLSGDEAGFRHKYWVFILMSCIIWDSIGGRKELNMERQMHRLGITRVQRLPTLSNSINFPFASAIHEPTFRLY